MIGQMSFTILLKKIITDDLYLHIQIVLILFDWPQNMNQVQVQ